MSGPSSSSFLQVSQMPGQNNRIKMVAGYALQEKLGSGSFAVVYKGVRVPESLSPQSQATVRESSDTVDTVAIKAITRTSEKLTKKVLQNLEIEISILRTYRHRNIVCLHDVQKTERHFYLILEYCAGGDLQGLIRTRKTKRLSEGLTRRLMRDLSAGLKFLWGQELIHRDIKPQNLLLTGSLPTDELNDPEQDDEAERIRREANFPSAQFCLKIADFGFARHLQTASLAETLCGSPLYMAPEILQHHRYDAKADLWSVGTVLFEMIAGRPPFHGENHIDLLRNIQRKAVRLPPDVRVSKECVNLLRLLLNRNPLSRAGFKEFFEACDAFVALGCQGVATVDEGTCQRPNLDLGTIPENDGVTAESMLTVATAAVPQQTHTRVPFTGQVTPPFGPTPTLTVPISIQQSTAMTLVHGNRAHPGLTPLVPSPPNSSVSPIYAISRAHAAVEVSQSGRRYEGSASQSNDEGSFVMVEKSSVAVSSSNDPYRQPQDAPRSRLETTPPDSPRFYLNKSPVLSTRGDYMVVKQPKGMLSTSPGTGGALMGMLSGRARLAYAGATGGKQLEAQILAATKMLAASEDVGRRAISVAHLGDNRAYTAMRLVMMSESSASSLISASPMEGIVEENVDHDSGAVTDDSSSTEIMASTRRRRSSSATAETMTDAKADEDADEMPFAMMAESPPLVAAGMPSREITSFNKGSSISSSTKPAMKPTPAVIRAHFSEALSCYLKALKMLKGAVGAAERVKGELDALSVQTLSNDQLSHVQAMQRRCEVTSNWLGGQFRGVLERGDAANIEIGKLPSSQASSQALVEKNEPVPITTAEELIYNNALAFGREGAVKQLLGQYEPARSCYRSAGLLAETLLMESNLSIDDRNVLEGYVDGFAARITELDEVMLQQSQQSRVTASSVTSSVASMRHGPGVVGLVGQSFASPNFNLGRSISR